MLYRRWSRCRRRRSPSNRPGCGRELLGSITMWSRVAGCFAIAACGWRFVAVWVDVGGGGGAGGGESCGGGGGGGGDSVRRTGADQAFAFGKIPGAGKCDG